MKKWCVECGEAGKPESATMVVDGDPLCTAHGRLRGTTPPAAKETGMADACACGCGSVPTAGRVYAWGHKPKASGGIEGPPVKRPQIAADKDDSNILDIVWAALPEPQKRQALNLLLSA